MTDQQSMQFSLQTLPKGKLQKRLLKFLHLHFPYADFVIHQANPTTTRRLLDLSLISGNIDMNAELGLFLSNKQASKVKKNVAAPLHWASISLVNQGMTELTPIAEAIQVLITGKLRPLGYTLGWNQYTNIVALENLRNAEAWEKATQVSLAAVRGIFSHTVIHWSQALSTSSCLRIKQLSFCTDGNIEAAEWQIKGTNLRQAFEEIQGHCLKAPPGTSMGLHFLKSKEIILRLYYAPSDSAPINSGLLLVVSGLSLIGTQQNSIKEAG